jgi:DNA-binding NarL/FixJ family response regulator
VGDHVFDDQPVRVLIVDDDARVRTALRSFLSVSPGFEVVGDAGSVDATLRLAHERTPAVVLADVLLPDQRAGLGLLRILSAELGIPVVAISIRGRVRHSALAAGAYRFLNKDSVPELILAALRAAVSSDNGRRTAS